LTKRRRIRGLGYVTLKGEKKCAYRGLVAKCPEKKRLGRHRLKLGG
jgi:hypothetical protein